MNESGSAQCSIHCNYYKYQLEPFFIELKILRKGTQYRVYFLITCSPLPTYYSCLHNQTVFAYLRDGGIARTWQLILVGCK